jgi:uncharacterized protein (TIGR03118 family)
MSAVDAVCGVCAVGAARAVRAASRLRSWRQAASGLDHTQSEVPVYRSTSSVRRPLTLGIVLAAALAACNNDEPTTPVLTSAYTVTKLVGDDASLGAPTVDANLVNAWGLAFSGGGTLWVSNNASHTSTLYNGAGVKSALIVTIPSATSANGGAPTGIVFNSTTDFVIPGGVKANFIFAGEDGTIVGWSSGATGTIVANRSTNDAVYKGLALASNGGANFLYATNFKGNAVDVFDKTFKYVSSFTDSVVPSGYAPFGIHTINGQLWVTFAKQQGPSNEDDLKGPGNGFVDIFNPDGTKVKRLVSNGRLNSPWAVVMAPTTFGSAGGDVLIGNFGDGRIGAYDPNTGEFKGYLHDSTNVPLTIDGLWDLTFGVGSAPATSLYFSAGPSNETHGLVGTLTAQ